ncbi:hypothetical protein NIIDMKKI_61200 [Mycobacterium kansasii]|uniref:GH15-like domain-containing protein n=1 Tax=Mycobacterium kansasii TaxID=1768 RepID=A0A7G1IKC0_MYCKA|nr:hypothetical protein NIIDMKKI_61200 [Mycobacterium kansasii]
MTTDGIVECREALAFPGDPHTVVLRRIRALDGPARMRVALDVRAGFGTAPMSGLRCRDGVWTGRSGPHRFRWTGAGDANRTGDGPLQAVVEVIPGSDHDLVLELSDQELPTAVARPNDAWHATESAWAAAVPTISGSLADADAQTAYAVLRGLTSSGGGMVAAATMSLPERAEQGRNYDYRYCWIRDQCYAGQAVAAAGADPWSTTPSVSSASVCWPTVPASSRPTASPATWCPKNRAWICRAIPGHRQDRQLGDRPIPAGRIR